MANIRTLSFDAIIIGGGGAGNARCTAVWLRAVTRPSWLPRYSDSFASIFRPGRRHYCAIASADPNDDWRAGTCTIPSRVPTISVTRMLSSTCVRSQKRSSSSSIRVCRSSLYRTRSHLSAPSGGQSVQTTLLRAARTCAAADRTGHAWLHTPHQNNIKHDTTFLK
jgi:succinate dehydrogenase / fumarate reductase flavoprotein subunit